jgi:ribosome-associated protein
LANALDKNVPTPADSSANEPGWLTAARAAEEKKANDLRVLDLREVTTFADYFVICSGSNPRQIQTIADEVALELKRKGDPAIAIEGYDGAEWILLDFGDFLVHVFSEKAREYYELERLWRHAKDVDLG